MLVKVNLSNKLSLPDHSNGIRGLFCRFLVLSKSACLLQFSPRVYISLGDLYKGLAVKLLEYLNSKLYPYPRPKFASCFQALRLPKRAAARCLY